MNHVKMFVIWFAIAFAAGFVAFHTPASAGEDVHVCSGIKDNAAILYSMVAEGQEPAAIVADIQAAVNAGVLNIPQASVLEDGLIFLVQVWGHPDLTLQRFQQTAQQVCEGRFGQIADRNNV